MSRQEQNYQTLIYLSDIAQKKKLITPLWSLLVLSGDMTHYGLTGGLMRLILILSSFIGPTLIWLIFCQYQGVSILSVMYMLNFWGKYKLTRLNAESINPYPANMENKVSS